MPKVIVGKETAVKKSTKKKVSKTSDTSFKGRKVKYPKTKVRLHDSEEPITAELAKKLLGWEEGGEKIKFGDTYLLKDYHKHKIRTFNNTVNRPFTLSIALTLKQEILRLRWNLNGETIIIGTTGQIINGQHSLIGLILAAQEWEDQEQWRENWKTEPTIEKIVVYGISEEDKVVNTVDTGKSRTLAEVIYRSGYFDNMKDKDRKTAARLADYCVRMLWHRTGAKLDSFAPQRTHSESLDFIARHERLLESVKHIHVEDDEGKITQFFRSPGYASAFLYLMGSGSSDADRYLEERNQESLDWANWSKACDFWVFLAKGDLVFKHLQCALSSLTEREEGSSLGERCAIVAKAWTLYVAEEPLTEEALQLDYHTNEDGERTLAECPTVGGIDLGNPSEPDPKPDPDPEELEELKATERNNRQNGG